MGSNQLARRANSGFTLVELLIVAVVLAIFASIVVPAISGSDDEAMAATAHSVVRSVSRIIDRERGRTGSWPANIDPAWFRGHKLPVNPFVPNHPATIRSNIDPDPTEWHPAEKTTKNAPFWYNPTNGAFRILVPEQTNRDETVALYNLANGTDVSALWETTK